MPYELFKQGDKFCVRNKDTGESKGCSDTQEMAQAHMRALYAHAADKEYEDAIKAYTPDQQSVDTQTVVDRILDGIKGMLPVKAGDVLTLTKQADGRTRVMMRVSNIFKDRHGEIITSVAHKEYESYIKSGGELPEFWLWHTKGTKWGQADLVSYDDGFLTVSGLVDVGKEQLAEYLASYKDLGVSHGFKGISVGQGTIDWYRMKEVSPLPRNEAANVWTSYMLAKERSMGLAEKHKKFFEALHIPGDVVESWDKENRDIAAVLKEAGIEYKELDNEPAAPATTETQVTPNVVLEELKKINSRIDGLESKQLESVTQVKEYVDSKMKDAVGDTLAAAITPGTPGGFVASKQGDKPTDSQVSSQKSWEEELTALIIGERN